MKKITLLFLFISTLATSQTYTLDNTFNPTDHNTYNQNIGVNGTILNNGKILTVMKNTGGETTGISRLNSDGSFDNTFLNPQLQNGGSILFANKILGNFILISGDDSSCILTSYDANGTLNSSFTSPTFTLADGTRPIIDTVIFLSTGKFLILGKFNRVNGISYNYIIRLNANGSIDTTFNIGTGFNNRTRSCAEQSDGKCIIGGDFYDYNGAIKRGIIRLNTNGLIDNTFDVYTTIGSFGITNGYSGYGTMNDIKIQPDGKIITSGRDMYLNGNLRTQNITRLNSNGSVDLTFYVNYPTTHFTGKVLCASDGSIYFRDANNIIKLKNSGAQDFTFNNTNQSGRNYDYSSDISEQNNKIIAVGDYYGTSGITRVGYHRLNLDGTIDLTFNPHFGPNTYSYQINYPSIKMYLTPLPDNKTLLYGSNASVFTTYNDVPVKSIVRLTENGEIDPGFNLSPSITSSMIVTNTNSAIQVKNDYDGNIYIKGDFSGNKLIKLNYDGSLDTSFNFTENLSVFKVGNDNKIIAAGTSGIFKNGSNYKIVRFNPDLTIDNTFVSPLFLYLPINMELVDNNKILISFGNQYTTSYNLIRLNQDGSLDTTFHLNNFGYSMYRTKTTNGKIYISCDGPSFSYHYLKRCNNDGTLDTSFTAIPTVEGSEPYLLLSNDRTVTATDQFDTNGACIYRINDSSGIQIGSITGPYQYYNSTYSISQNCENIIFTGLFSKIYGINKSNIYRLTVPGSTITPTPTAELNQLFNQGQTLSDLIVNGQNIQWYNQQNQCAFNGSVFRNSDQTNSIIPNSTILVDGTTYYASQTINGIESNNRLPITVHQNLGIKSNGLSHLTLSPVPIINKLHLKNDQTIDKVEVYNNLCQKLIDLNFDNNDINVDFSEYNAGIYFVKVYSNNMVSSKKVIKN